MDLNKMYKAAGQKAFNDGIDPGNENDLINWINQNCSFDPDKLFFLVLGVGSELADISSQSKGFDNQTHKIWQTKIAPNWKCDKFGKWHRI